MSPAAGTTAYGTESLQTTSKVPESVVDKLYYAGCSPLLPFILSIFLGLPLVLVLLPFALLAYALKLVTCNYCASPAKRGDAPALEMAVDIVPVADRPFAAVLFGATGFTGI